MLPAGVTIPELKLGKEHDVAVAIAKEIKEEVEEAPAAEAEAVAGAAAPAAAAGAPAKSAAPAKAAAPAKDEKKK